MKKLLLILAIGAFVACNDNATSTSNPVDSTLDDASNSVENTGDSLSNKVNSTIEAGADSLENKTDSLKIRN